MTQPTTTNNPRQDQSKTKHLILTISLALLLRTLISVHPHSGQDNHHGSKIAYGGDYEAQRHWMEITYHLPISQWYKYDVQYWGLDYPPLTAYGSYVLGWLSDRLVGSESVALDDSRGYEDVRHKGFMRASVIVLDCVVYIPFVYWIMKRLMEGHRRHDCFEGFLLAVLIQPALLIIDHGHFQYNAVCLGLALGSFYFMTNVTNNRIDMNCVIGSILFCLALNWKQMALYYAPAVFSYLLGRCFAPAKKDEAHSCRISGCRMISGLMQIALLGVTVLSTFSILWLPFYFYRDDENESVIDVFGVLIERIFPLQRGLFEGKVGNIWCAASVKPISIRQRIPPSVQPVYALVLTLLMILPFCTTLFQIGKTNMDDYTKSKTQAGIDLLVKQRHLKALLLGSAGTSLSFFLASFQVHEKSILLPLAPLSLLAFEKPTVVFWFSFVALWSMWHLIVVDRLQAAYFSLIILFACNIEVLNRETDDAEPPKNDDDGSKRYTRERDIVIKRYIVQLSVSGMLVLHIVEAIFTPPSHLPDVFPVLWVIVSCMSFCFMWFILFSETLDVSARLVQRNDSEDSDMNDDNKNKKLQ